VPAVRNINQIIIIVVVFVVFLVFLILLFLLIIIIIIIIILPEKSIANTNTNTFFFESIAIPMPTLL